MNTAIKKIMLASLVMLLTACVHYPRPYGNYSGNGPNYPGPGYNKGYGNHHHHRQPGANNYGGYGRPYGNSQSNNYYQNNYYNRPQPRAYQAPAYQGYGGYGNHPSQNWGNGRGNHNGHGHHDDDHGHRDRD